jgi:hypothetical protein
MRRIVGADVLVFWLCVGEERPEESPRDAVALESGI